MNETIQHILNLRKKAEGDILKILMELEGDTGLQVHYISTSHIDISTVEGKNYITKVKIDLTLPE